MLCNLRTYVLSTLMWLIGRGLLRSRELVEICFSLSLHCQGIKITAVVPMVSLGRSSESLATS